MTVAFLFACVGLGALGLSFWGWVSCFSESLRIRERRVEVFSSADEVLRRGGANAAPPPAQGALAP